MSGVNVAPTRRGEGDHWSVTEIRAELAELDEYEQRREVYACRQARSKVIWARSSASVTSPVTVTARP